MVIKFGFSVILISLRKRESNILRTKVLEVMWTFKSPYRATG